MHEPLIRPLDTPISPLSQGALTITHTFSDPAQPGGVLIASTGMQRFSVVQHAGHVTVTDLTLMGVVGIKAPGPIVEEFVPVLNAEGRECFDLAPVAGRRQFSPRLFRRLIRQIMGSDEAHARDVDLVFDVDDAIEFVSENNGVSGLTWSVLDRQGLFFEIPRDQVQAVQVLTLIAREARAGLSAGGSAAVVRSDSDIRGAGARVEEARRRLRKAAKEVEGAGDAPGVAQPPTCSC